MREDASWHGVLHGLQPLFARICTRRFGPDAPYQARGQARFGMSKGNCLFLLTSHFNAVAN
jgi:hypothetical protein